MKISKLLGQRFRETPAECKIASHVFMLRGGYIKNVGHGIFSLFTPARRITQKIEAIIRQEMERVDGQEVLLPLAIPACLWKKSGRFDTVGSELLKFKDRSGVDMLLAMTHEESAVHLAQDTAHSYVDFPFMIYQIQTKFRDEPRARGGLIRVREFTMKDAYSFHITEQDLENYYSKCHEAYERIFARVGISEVVSVKSDSGMMGGKVAHEFMLLTEIGEDSLVICGNCHYRSNLEIAECIVENSLNADKKLTLVETPNQTTIDEICSLLNVTPECICKAVVYQKNETNEMVLVFIRGDLDVNESKLRNHLNCEVHPAVDLEDANIVCGFIGPIGIEVNGTIVFDRSLCGAHNVVCGANKKGYHYVGFTPGRDLASNNIKYYDLAKTCEGAICPSCGERSLSIKKGIEVGNIFQLGDKYTNVMGMKYLDKDGILRTPIMGCYGIGIGRLAAAVCEAHRDENGPIWPISIAPWHVHICALRIDNADVASLSQRIYDDLVCKGAEVILDDRVVSAGVMFSDADLLGVPIRLIISPKTCERGIVEVSLRDRSFHEDVSVELAVDYVIDIVKKHLGTTDKGG